MYDPALPADDSPLSSAEMRSQLTGLKALIDAIATITGAQVDGVTTLPPGFAAGASVSVVGNTLHFTFELPAGDTGAMGPVGPQGSQGEVSAQQLTDAIQTTSANTNTVGPLSTAFADPDAEALRQKVNELILALRR